MQAEILEKLNHTVSEKLSGGALFLVAMQLKPGRRIEVEIDGDNGVLVRDCAELSRHIIQTLGDEAGEYEIQVASAGVGRPLLLHRQFVKNVGRLVEVVLTEGTKVSGTLTEAGPPIMLALKADKKKKLPDRTISIEPDKIKECRVAINFNT